MDDNVAWLGFKNQLQAHYEALEACHRELGGDYEDSSSSLMDVLQAALQASLEATKAECDRVRADCESMLQDMAMMRTAMGEFSKSTGPDDPFTSQDARVRIKTPLLDTQKVLRIEHSATRKAFDDRASKVITLYERLRAFEGIIPQELIGISIPFIDDQNPPDDVSLSKLGMLDAACARCKQEVAKRKLMVQSYGKEIVLLWAELAIETSALDHKDRAILLDAQDKPERLGLLDSDLNALEQKRRDLLTEKKNRQQTIAALLKSIKSLHAKLRLPEAELEAFVSRARGVIRPVIELCENELARLVELKKDHIEDFVKDARMVLEGLWDKLYLNEDDRLDFSPAFASVFTDASLQAHENEIARLQLQISELEPMLSLLARHMELVREKQELEIQTSDPARFSKRGYNPMAESKLRVKIENTLPRVEAALREAFEKYEETNLVPFRVWGEIYLQEESVTKRPTLRADHPQTRVTNLNDSLNRPKTGNIVKQSRPKTPGTLPRPPTTGSTMSFNSQGQLRSASTPVRTFPSSGQSSSRSPTKRAISHNITNSNSKNLSAMKERTIPTATKLPARTRDYAIPSSVNRKFKLPEERPAAKYHEENRPVKSTQTLRARPMSPPRMTRPVAEIGRDFSNGSIASHLSTENWDSFPMSSDEEDAVSTSRRPSREKANAEAPIMRRPAFTPTSSTASKAEHIDSPPLTEVPEEASFIDEWGDEGF